MERFLINLTLNIFLLVNSGNLLNAQDLNCITGNWYSVDSEGHYYEMYILRNNTIYFMDLLSGESISHYIYKNDTLTIYDNEESARSFLIEFLNQDKILAKANDTRIYINRIHEEIDMSLFNNRCLKERNIFWNGFKRRLENNLGHYDDD